MRPSASVVEQFPTEPACGRGGGTLALASTNDVPPWPTGKPDSTLTKSCPSHPRPLPLLLITRTPPTWDQTSAPWPPPPPTPLPTVGPSFIRSLTPKSPADRLTPPRRTSTHPDRLSLHCNSELSTSPSPSPSLHGVSLPTLKSPFRPPLAHAAPGSLVRLYDSASPVFVAARPRGS